MILIRGQSGDRMIKASILMGIIVLLGMSGYAACPSADLTGDCHVDLDDLAVMAGQMNGEIDFAALCLIAEQWLTEGIRDIVFVDIGGGTFQMGDGFGEGWAGEAPLHTVTVGALRMSKYEVTNAQYAEFLNSAADQGLIKVENGVVYHSSDDANSRPWLDTAEASPYSRIVYANGVFSVADKSGRGMSNDPVVEVSWYGARAFCDYYGYRLPTEAEWEYAARGNLSGRRFPRGDTITHSRANYYNCTCFPYDISPTSGHHPLFDDGVYPYTAPVGSFAPNGYGLCDMAGNVWEWCADWYDQDYYSVSPENNPQGPAQGDRRVIRGGSWASDADFCRVAFRFRYNPDDRAYYYGFRPVVDLQ